MAKKLVAFLFVFLFLISFTSAIDSLGYFTIDKPVELIQTGSNETSLLSYCNISSVKYPNSTVFLSNQIMSTTDDTYFNYTVNASNTGELGRYIVTGFCGIEGGEMKTYSYDFIINYTGWELTTGESIIYFLFLVGAICVLGLSLYGSIVIPWRDYKSPDSGQVIGMNDWKFLKLFLIVTDYLLLMWVFGIIRSITANFLFLVGASKVFNWLYWIMISFAFPIIIVGMLVFIISWLNGKKMKEALSRGLPIN